ncbi:MAG TPA: hypothetical protein VFT55_03685 [Planctomycetota bacterium]|nr:hypothetical protein [Planctomycetota bacterium]
MPPSHTTPPLRPSEVIVRSLFPLVAIALLASVPWIGPWWFLVATFVWWRVVTVVG